MTTSKYLNSVLQILPAVQARQLSDLLNELQVSGEITNRDEYQTKLTELASLVNSTEPVPSFKQIRSLIWHIATAEGHNQMMTALKNDIEALFLQIDEMGKKVDDHQFLFMQNLLSDMERGIKDQENTIRRLEWLAGQNNEFSLAIVNSFTSSSLQRVPRTEFGADTLYFDNRTYKNKTEKELPSAVVSEHAEQLYLGTDNDSAMLPVSVRLLSDSSSYGTQIQTDIDNSITNIIDGTKGTYWRRDVYLAEKVPKVTTVLEFDFGVAKDCNYVIIEGATETPFQLESIEGVSPDGHSIYLNSTTTIINGWKRINFNRTLIKGVKITFAVKSYFRAEFFTKKQDELLKVVNPKNKFDKIGISKALGPLTAEVITSQNLAKILNIPTGVSQQINSHHFPFALDNVWFGNSLYGDSGIFVSKPLKGNDFGVIAVQTDEAVGTGTVRNSIEYEIIKRDITPKYKETRFPIPYLGQTSVVSERLILTKRESDSTVNDAGSLRLCPYVDPEYTIGDKYPVRVYENGVELNPGSRYQVAIKNTDSTAVSELDWRTTFVDGDSDTRVFSNFKLNPTKMYIKILKPDPTAIYTVDYDIRTSDTYIDDDTMWMDEEKTIFLSDGGRVNFRRENPDVTIQSEVYLQITLRRNVASQATTPELNEYAVLGATYNG